MKESSFIKKNLDSWNEYEKVISSKEEKPLKISKLFIKITDDLSYSYTYYKNRSVRLYLNGIAKLLFNRVNNSESFRFSSIKKYFTESVPLAIYQARKEFYIAFAIFVVAMIIGILSSKYDPEFAQLILGEDYIKMTQINIAENDPMAVYKSQAPFDMFFAITVNNCLVAIRTFVLGFFMAIGTIFIMLYNGIMVGSFQYFFVEQGLFKESFLTIWQHGVLEISSIIMSGAAGLVLGKGLVFPGNYTRFQSLRISARRGLKLLLGILPILLIAAFIEGFYTRFTNAPDVLRILTILISLAFVIGYFIVLPIYRSRQLKETIDVDNKIDVTGIFNIDLSRIYQGTELFMLTFQSLKVNFSKILKISFSTSLLITILLYSLDALKINEVYSGITIFNPLESLYNNTHGIYLLTLSFFVLYLLLSRLILNPDSIQLNRKIRPISFLLQVSLILITVHLPLIIPSAFFGILLFITLLVYSTFLLNILVLERVDFIKAIKISTLYLKGNFSKFMFLSLRFLLLGVLFYFTFKLIIVYLNQLIEMNLYGSLETRNIILYYINTFYFCLVLFLISSFIYLGNQILYYSLYETYHAKNLLSKINQIGKTKRIRGLIRE